MTTHRKTFIRHLFHFLAGKGYLWLKAIFDNPVKVPETSDIDLLVKPEDLGAVRDFACRQKNVAHAEVDDQANTVYLTLCFEDGGFLKLDLLTQLVRKQWKYLNENYLFEKRIWQNGIAMCPPEILLEHVLLFNFLNHGGLPKKYVGYFSTLPEEEQERVLFFINEKYATAFGSIAEMRTFRPKLRRFFIQYLKKKWENDLPRRIERGLQFLRSKTKNLRQKSEIITFTGVDGAGKTTLLYDLKKVLTQQFGRRVVVLRHRPSVLPILSAWTQGKAAAEHRAATTLPRQGQNNNRTGSLLRFAYYYSDYLFGQFYVHLRYILPGYAVIYDRYYFDFIVDGKRSNINLGEALPKWLFRFVIKPRLNVFLYASPEVVRQRKQELPAADIAEMTAQYRVLFEEFAERYEGKYLCIENIDRSETLGRIIEGLFLEKKEGKIELTEVQPSLSAALID